MPPPLRFLRTASHLQVRMDILASATHQEATAKPVMSPSDYSSPVAVSNFIFFRSSRSTWLHSRLLLKNCFFFQRKMWLQLLELVAHKTMVDPISSFAESGQPACVHVPAWTWTRPLPCLRMFHSMYKLNTSTLTWPSCEVCWALDLW